MSTGKVITGIAAGITAGAILGILFAPDRGTETRKKIAQKGTDFKDGIRSKFSSLVGKVNNEYDNVKDKAADMMNKGKEKADGWKADAKYAIS